LVHRITGVRLYAPNLRHVDLAAPGYYFLATDTPNVMRWLAGQAEHSGAHIAYRKSFAQAERTQSGFDLGDLGTTRFLVGADGPGSRVAEALGLGQSAKFLFGLEYEYEGVEIAEPDKLHCFIDGRLAPGYIAWVVAGVGIVQVGLARRIRGDQSVANAAMSSFLEKIAPLFDFRLRRPASVRAGMIPCGGVVRPVAAKRVLLVGDAAGMVSPVTAGGIHTALKHGLAAGHAVVDYLNGKSEDPSGWFVRSYPRYRVKRLLRFLFDHFQSDLFFNLLLSTKPMRMAAGIVYFHHKGVFIPPSPAATDHANTQIAEDKTPR
jgi:digeranylgeranylglycerophospholipid reductase